jgi:tetratricopeptide (TPR) repeat protein
MDLILAQRTRKQFLDKQTKRKMRKEALSAAEGSFSRKALLVYNDAMEEYPWDWELRADLWQLEMKLERFPQALASARLVTRVQPTFAKGHLMKGLAFMELRRYPEAVEALALGLEYHPSGPALIASFNEAKKQLGGFKRTSSTRKQKQKKPPPPAPSPSYPIMCKKFGARKEGDGDLKLICTTVEIQELLKGLPEEILKSLGELKHRELARGMVSDPDANKDLGRLSVPKTLADSHKIPHYAPCINLVHQFGLSRQYMIDLYERKEAGSYLSEVIMC